MVLVQHLEKINKLLLKDTNISNIMKLVML